MFNIKYHFIRSWWNNPKAVSRKVSGYFYEKYGSYTRIRNSGRAFWNMQKYIKSTTTCRKRQFFTYLYNSYKNVERIKGIYHFSCKKLQRNCQRTQLFLLQIKPKSNSHIFVFCLSNIVLPCDTFFVYKTPITLSLSHIDIIHSWYKRRFVSQGGDVL